MELAFQPTEEGSYDVLFADFYMAALANGYTKLLDACPKVLQQRWQFKVVH